MVVSPVIAQRLMNRFVIPPLIAARILSKEEISFNVFAKQENDDNSNTYSTIITEYSEIVFNKSRWLIIYLGRSEKQSYYEVITPKDYVFVIGMNVLMFSLDNINNENVLLLDRKYFEDQKISINGISYLLPHFLSLSSKSHASKVLKLWITQDCKIMANIKDSSKENKRLISNISFCEISDLNKF